MLDETGQEKNGEEMAGAAGDEVYGRDPALRAFCEARGMGYVLGVPCSFTVGLTARRKARADQALKLVPARAWQRASCGPGSKGDRAYA